MDLNMVGHDFLCAFPRVGGASCIRQLGKRSPREGTRTPGEDTHGIPGEDTHPEAIIGFHH